MNEDLKMKREGLTIEGGRNLYSYTFTDAAGNVLEPEPVNHATLPKEGPAAASPKGNLGSKEEGANRKG